jgi:uncharacterized membrane-anchored protein
VIIQALCTSYREEAFRGVHRAEDDYRMALYMPNADLGPETTAYTPVGEHPSVGGYVAGGKSISGFRTVVDRGVVVLTFDSLLWEHSTINARAALLYNATREGRAVAVFDFRKDAESMAGVWVLPMPEATRETGLIRWA